MAKQGTPAAVVEQYTANDPKSNASYKQALKVAEFYNSFTNRPSLNVRSIVAIEPHAAATAAYVPSFNELRAMGVSEDDRIYLAFDRRKSKDDDIQIGVNMEIVGLALNVIAKASSPYEAFSQLVQSVDPTIENDDLPVLLLGQGKVFEAANEFLETSLSV